MSKKCNCALSILLLIGHFAISQVNYIATDTSSINNLKLIVGTRKNNAHFITSLENGKTIKYYPKDLVEYGLKDGRVYSSLNFNIKENEANYFFERLYKNQFQIYYLPEKIEENSFYFSLNDSSRVMPLPSSKKELRTFFKEHLKNCPIILRDIKYVKASRESISRLLNNYERCNKGNYFPRIRYGISMGVSFLSFSDLKNEEIRSMSLDNAIGFTYGGYIDLPIRSSNFSLQSGLTFINYKNSTVLNAPSTIYNLVINQWRLNAPIVFRYIILEGKYIPFIEGGFIYSKEIKGDVELYKYQTSGSNVFIDFSNNNYIPTDQGGFSGGFGISTNYNSKYSFLFQIKFNRLFDLQGTQTSLIVSEAVITGGLIF
jgi:hypothetical protein